MRPCSACTADKVHVMKGVFWGGHLGPVADVLGAVCVVERGERLLLALHRGGNCGDDARLGAATKRIAQQSASI
jgi:hypothetical protein